MLLGRRAMCVCVLVLSSGCAYAVRSTRTQDPTQYASTGRPEASYYCYDCHGYRYFDPYYDWCANYGFVYRWERSPEAVRLYRERYVQLKWKDRRLGRLSYPEGYRSTRRYREPRDYDAWRKERPERGRGERIRKHDPEQGAPDRGRKERDPRDDDSSRPGRPRSRRI